MYYITIIPSTAPLLLKEFFLRPQAANANGIKVAVNHLVGAITSKIDSKQNTEQ